MMGGDVNEGRVSEACVTEAGVTEAGVTEASATKRETRGRAEGRVSETRWISAWDIRAARRLCRVRVAAPKLRLDRKQNISTKIATWRVEDTNSRFIMI